MLLLVQLALFAAFILLALWVGPARWEWLRAMRRSFRRLARQERLAIVVVGLVTFIGSAALTLATGLPQPMGHDEFSYLLAADTFAHGRATNPPHPLWEHFESPHILQQPTYASKFPPAQGLFLAAGQVLFGQPIVGVWLSLALACAAICWMLQAWLPPRWALAGGLLAAFQLTLFGRAHVTGPLGYWSQSYWGGAVAALGGALLFGSLHRIVRPRRVGRVFEAHRIFNGGPRRLDPPYDYAPHIADAILLAVGLVLLANSRPFEGLIASLPAAALLLWLLVHRRWPLRQALTRLVLPALAVLLPAGAAMAWYNQQVTGDPLRLPYQVHEAQYGAAPLFLWQPLPAEPSYRHAALRDFHVGWERDFYQRQTSFAGWLVMTLGKAKLLLNFYLGGVVMVLPWLALGWMSRNCWMAFALATCGLLGVALFSETWAMPHYAAPLTALVFVLVMQGMRHIRLWQWRGRPLGRCVIAAVPLVCLATLLVSIAAGRAPDPDAGYLQRARLVAELRAAGESHLVIVSDSSKPGYDCWVYNAADIDAAPIVWARAMDCAHDRRLLAYFKGRRVWLLDTDAEPARLVPYPSENGECSYCTGHE